MTEIDIGARLREADPVMREPALSGADTDAMRRAVVAAASRSAEGPAWFPPVLALVTTAAALIIAVAGARTRDRGAPQQATVNGSHSGADSSAGSGRRRQLQFATPGGTRVIWVFDPEFNP
jgi:hypothetical protein